MKKNAIVFSLLLAGILAVGCGNSGISEDSVIATTLEKTEITEAATTEIELNTLEADETTETVVPETETVLEETTEETTEEITEELTEEFLETIESPTTPLAVEAVTTVFEVLDTEPVPTTEEFPDFEDDGRLAYWGDLYDFNQLKLFTSGKFIGYIGKGGTIDTLGFTGVIRDEAKAYIEQTVQAGSLLNCQIAEDESTISFRANNENGIYFYIYYEINSQSMDISIEYPMY